MSFYQIIVFHLGTILTLVVCVCVCACARGSLCVTVLDYPVIKDIHQIMTALAGSDASLENVSGVTKHIQQRRLRQDLSCFLMHDDSLRKDV